MSNEGFLSDEELLRRREERLQKKNKNRIRRRLILAAGGVVILVAAVLLIRGCSAKSAAPAGEPAEPEAVAIPMTEDAVVRIAAVGDITVSDALLRAAETEHGGYDFSSCLSAVSAYTMAADLTVGNLELNFCGAPYEGFNAPETLCTALAGAGFDILQTANSASIQNGLNGLQSTADVLNAAGIDHLGTYRSAEELAASQGVVLKTVNNIRIAFIGFTKGLDNLALPVGSEYAVDVLYEDYYSDYSEIAEDAVTARIACAKQFAPDVIIAMVHWGSEYDNTVTPTQEKLLKLLAENGVDVILGTHSHLVSSLTEIPVTQEDGSEKYCFVAYSLGNFFAEPTQSKTQESILLNLEIVKSAQTGAVSIGSVSYLPLYLLSEQTEDRALFEVLPIRSAITSSYYSDYTEQMTAAIADLRAATASDYDCGK